MFAIGIDPGTKGAIAFIDLKEGTVEWHDIPFYKVRRGRSKAKNELAEYEVAELLRSFQERSGGQLVATIEVQSPRPMIAGREGMHGNLSSMNTQLGTYYMLRGLLCGCGIRYDAVTPGEWQKRVGTTRHDDDSRAAAAKMFPLLAPRFAKGKCRVDVCEALLIAAYGLLDNGHSLPNNLATKQPTKEAA